MVQRYKCIVEYCGKNFFGWARNTGLGPAERGSRTVQGAIEMALNEVSKRKPTLKWIDTYGAGRTDSGVHGLGQVFHLDLPKQWNYSGERVTRMINYNLRKHDNGNEITILQCNKVNKSFHARHSAIERTYIYRIWDSVGESATPVFERGRVWMLPNKNKLLDIGLMKQGANALIGEYDRSSFRNPGCYRDSAVTKINNIDIAIESPSLLSNHTYNNSRIITIRISAPCFLYRQIRITTALLVDIGKGLYPNVQDHIDYLHHIKSRHHNKSITAPPDGLYFEKVTYNDDDEFIDDEDEK